MKHGWILIMKNDTEEILVYCDKPVVRANRRKRVFKILVKLYCAYCSIVKIL